MEVQRLLQEEEDGWKRLLSAFEAVPPGRLEEPTLTPEGWSAKDAMFHVGYWLEDCARVLAGIQAGSYDGDAEGATDIEAINGESFTRSSQMDAGTVRAGFMAAREQALGAFDGLDTVTPEAWEWFEESGPLHYAKHVEDLNAWLRA